MTHLIVQTAMLLLAAYVLGAICGSLLHRLLAARAGTGGMLAAAGASAPAAQPMIEVSAAPAPAIPGLSTANRFERALIGPRYRSRADAPAPDTGASSLSEPQVPMPGDAEPEIEPEIAAGEQHEALPLEDAASSGPANVELAATPMPEIAEPEFVQGAPPEPEPITASGASSNPITEPAHAGLGLAVNAPGLGSGTFEPPRAMSLPAAAGSGGVIGTSAPLAPFPQQSADDLTRIRDIDADTASRLADLGVSSYARLAAFNSADVARVEASLGHSRLSQENWIEQAQLLADGRTTVFARQLAGEAPDVQAAAETYAQQEIAADDTPAIEPAPMTEAEPSAIENPVQDPAAEVPPASTSGEPEAAAITNDSAEASAPSLEPTTGAAAEIVPAAPEDAPSADELASIRGIDPAAEAILQDHGVRSFADIARWRLPEVSRFENLIGAPGRISRENWIEQAQILANGGHTAFSRRRQSEPQIVARDPEPDHTPSAQAVAVHTAPDLAAPARPSSGQTETHPQPAPGKSHLASLRSVKSPLIAGYETRDGSAVDDLKRIRGIGLLIEKKLNSLGVFRYSQIANWTAAEVARISQMLDFKGRIERECWIEQARILASGGQTEFSSRVDRG